MFIIINGINLKISSFELQNEYENGFSNPIVNMPNSPRDSKF